MFQCDQEFDSAFVSVLRDYPWLGPDETTEHPFSSVPRFRRTAAFLRELAPPPGKVLDIGAWPGVLTTCLRRMGWEVTAIDKEAERQAKWKPSDLLNRMWKSAPAQGETLSFAEICRREGIPHYSLDIERSALPFNAEDFDAVIMTEVIEHLFCDPLFALGEINRVLKIGTGALILSTPNFLSIRNRLNFMLGHIEKVIEHPFVAFLKKAELGHLGHLRLYSPVELNEMLRLLGFTPEFRYDQMVYDQVPNTQNFAIQNSSGCPSANGKHEAASSPQKRHQPSGFRRLMAKVIRSPRSYLHAAEATAMSLCERYVPSLRPQMFVTARKVAGPDFSCNYPEEVARLVRGNR